MKKDIVKTGLLFVMLVSIIYAVVMIVLPFTGIEIGSKCDGFMSGSCISGTVALLWGMFSIPVVILTVIGYKHRSPIASLIGCFGFLIYNLFVPLKTSYRELIVFTFINDLLFLILIIINLILLKIDNKKI